VNRNGDPRTSGRRLAAADRQRQALELRKAGHSFERIAVHLGYRSKSGAYDAVLAGLRATLQEPADAVRALELERCDRLQAALWPAALQGDVAAVAGVLRILDRRARYLGLDAPHVIDVSVRLRVLAEALGLDPEAAIAEAERLVRDGRHHAPPA
jgi:hypothetical protein